MTIEQKKEALYRAVNSAWKDAFDGWEWDDEADSPLCVLGVPTEDACFGFFLSGCEDVYSGLIWVEYMPEEDFLGVYIKNSPIQPKFKEDLKNLFEKYAPFNMKVAYEGESTPILSREAKVVPKDFMKFFEEFRKAYDEYYPLFYMFTVSAKGWYDGFDIVESD